MIELERVTYRYPGASAPALREVSLILGPGGVTGLIGANGSGKTTLVRHLNGLLRPQAGHVLFEGGDITGLRTARLADRIAVVAQDPDLQLTQSRVRAEMTLGVPEQLHARIEPVLERCGISWTNDLHPHELARGAKTWVLIAAALVRRPRVLVLDEPTSAMDDHQTERLAGLVRELGETGTTVIVASHDLDFLVEVCTDVALLEAGRLSYHGRTDRLVDPRGELADLARHVELTELSSACGLNPAATSLAEAVRRLRHLRRD